jgi:large subunit ribosomal protein L32e
LQPTDEEKEIKEKKDTPKKTVANGEKKEVPKKKPVKAPSKKSKAEGEKKEVPKKKPVKAPSKKPKAEEEKKEVKKSPPKKDEKKEKPKEEKIEKPSPKPKKEVKKVKEVEEEVIITEEEEDEASEEEIEIVEEEEGEYKVKIKPKLGKGLKHDLQIRRTIKRKTPHFKQQEWFRYKRISESWRKPRGMHSKMRKHKGYRPNVVSIGYGSPSKARNLHPSGFEEIMVYNPKDLEKINPKSQAARVGHSVGTRKRLEIEKVAEKKGIRVLNPRRL